MVVPALLLAALAAIVNISSAACPYMDNRYSARDLPADHPPVRRSTDDPTRTDEFLSKFELNDTDTFMTSDVGGPISDQESLRAGERGPTLLEDFIFRQKIMHFDHERVPERAVHARGAGAHGVFTSYGDWSNITGASFLNAPGKETDVFIRFSTVAGSRGSADTARDVHGFAVRFYTDEGNQDIVGNNIPVFFIQDAIKFPDLIHAVKPEPDREIPQAASAHDTFYDFASQQPSALHTLFWAMSGHGTVRGYRFMHGWGVHTFRFVTDDGRTKLVKFRFRTLQGQAALVWEEAQVTAGKDADFHRRDLWDAIEKGRFPEWELQAQIMDEADQLRFGFDLLDPTKIVPEDWVPFTPLGKLTLNRNPRNYFAETEQVMFQPGHIVRGIDFTEDPLLQGRLFSYLDTQLNRNGGPNFEQLPINQPRIPWHNNNRDGAGQMYIPLNTAAYTPNTLNDGSPRQANQTTGRGFFTAPDRTASGRLLRTVPSTFANVWSQPRVFYNSLHPTEQQFLINALRFEIAHVKSDIVKSNILIQLNRVGHDIAKRVADALGLLPPAPDPTYYTTNRTIGVSIAEHPLDKIDGLKVGYLTTITTDDTSKDAFKAELEGMNLDFVVVAEALKEGVNQTYSATDASQFDAIIVGTGTDTLFTNPAPTCGNTTFTACSLYPVGRPLQILVDAYRWGKPVGTVDPSSAALSAANIPSSGAGVYPGVTAGNIEDGLKTFKFLDRFPLDRPSSV